MRVLSLDLNKEDYKIFESNYIFPLHFALDNIDEDKIFIFGSPLVGINAFGFNNLHILFYSKDFEDYILVKLDDFGYFFEFLNVDLIIINNSLSEEKFLNIYYDYDLRDIIVDFRENFNLRKDLKYKIFISILCSKNFSIFFNKYYAFDKYSKLCKKLIDKGIKGIILNGNGYRRKIKKDINDLFLSLYNKTYIDSIKRLKKGYNSLGNYCFLSCREEVKKKNYFYILRDNSFFYYKFGISKEDLKDELKEVERERVKREVEEYFYSILFGYCNYLSKFYKKYFYDFISFFFEDYENIPILVREIFEKFLKIKGLDDLLTP